MLRSWLKKRGKQHCIDFDDEELRQLRNYFNSLDDDGSGAIGVDELEDPLIALGLVENRQQVASIVAMVDEDGSQQIEFDEFLSIIKGGNTSVRSLFLITRLIEISIKLSTSI
jgi:Ca2+-binding EF-hand superfamily protein